MNLFSLLSNPEDLDYHGNQDLVPVAWEKYKDNPEEAKKREKMWARYPEIAYEYAYLVLKGPFKLGEPAIAKNPSYSYLYTRDVLKGPFKLGEPAIAKDQEFANLYQLLKGVVKNAK